MRVALMPLVWFSAGALSVGLIPMMVLTAFALVLMAWGALGKDGAERSE